MNFEKITQTLVMLGSDFPAYRALFEQVVTLFSDSDQERLKIEYEKAMTNADAAHRAAQSLKD